MSFAKIQVVPLVWKGYRPDKTSGERTKHGGCSLTSAALHPTCKYLIGSVFEWPDLTRLHGMLYES